MNKIFIPISHFPHLKQNFIRCLSETMSKSQFFLDQYTIDVYAGNGGKGIFSFEVTRDGRKIPSGGNGGHGGNIYIRGSSHMDRLYFPKRVYKSSNGENGQGKGMNGKNGKDLYIDVPLGCCVYRIDQEDNDMIFEEEEEEEEEDVDIEDSDKVTETLLCDIIKANQSVLIAQGGKGGEGNMSAYNRIKRRRRGSSHSKLNDEDLEEFSFEPKIHHNSGTRGEHYSLLVRLKLLASIGLVGYPNAGKSSLLSRLTQSVPKIAAYPFTTLRPLIGYIKYNDNRRISVADIPGILEGAHENRGLGLSFIKHIERTRILAYVLDCSDPLISPISAFEKLRNELKKYDSQLPEKPSVLVANKLDVSGSEKIFQELQRQLGGQYPLYPISCKSGKGLNRLALGLRTLYDEL